MGYAILKISSKNTMFFVRENGEKVMKSFRMKMICILLGVSLVPLIVATVYSYNILSKNLYQKINMETMSSIEMLAKSIDNELQDRKSVV